MKDGAASNVQILVSGIFRVNFSVKGKKDKQRITSYGFQFITDLLHVFIKGILDCDFVHAVVLHTFSLKNTSTNLFS